MFNSHQIDLLSENSSFIYTSSVLSSLLIFLTTQYMIFMLVPKFSKTLHFDEHNITKFLECFEKQCNEYKIIEKEQ